MGKCVETWVNAPGAGTFWAKAEQAEALSTQQTQHCVSCRRASLVHSPARGVEVYRIGVASQPYERDGQTLVVETLP